MSSLRGVCAFLLLANLPVERIWAAQDCGDLIGEQLFPSEAPYDFYFPVGSGAFNPDSCTPFVHFTYVGPVPASGPATVEIVEYAACKQTRTEIYSGPDSGAMQALTQLCGMDWYSGYFGEAPSPFGVQASVARALTAPPLSGQASENFLLADVNGDGIPDSVYLGSTDLVVQLLDSSGNVLPDGGFPCRVHAHAV
jgi:hypothetical protein